MTLLSSCRAIGLFLTIFSLLLIASCGGDSQEGNSKKEGCILASDCDGDGVHNDWDIDDDGNGLIEIGTARELDVVRYSLNGEGRRYSQRDPLDTTGCGNGVDVTVCYGYELINDIALADYIAKTYPISGWQPIAHDTSIRNPGCQGGSYNGVFAGNGFEVSGLFINRSQQSCIGLLGQVKEVGISNVGVVADKIIGSNYVGGLVGYLERRDVVGISNSYAVSSEISGDDHVGGLVGYLEGENVVGIFDSYAVSGEVSGSDHVGGLVGYLEGDFPSISDSYAVSGEASGSDHVGA